MALKTQDVSIEGIPELMKQFDQLINFVDEPKMEAQLYRIAVGLKNDIQTVTPEGPTGNLKSAIEARRFKRKIKGSPAVYVRVNRKRAPHYHLVEFGTASFRFPLKHRVLHFWTDEGEEVFTRWVAPMPQQPFFRPTVDRERYRVEQQIENVVERAIMEIDKSHVPVVTGVVGV